MKIKTLRRIETEIDNELLFVSQRLRRGIENSATRKDAEDTGANLVAEAKLVSEALISAKFQIRAMVAEFNQEKGINAKTAKLAVLASKVEFIEQNLSSMPRVRSDKDYHTHIVSYTAGISDSVEDELRADIRAMTRQIQSLKDSCNGINSQGDIEVSEGLLTLFKAYSLVD